MIIYEMKHPASGLVYIGATTVSLAARRNNISHEPQKRIKKAFQKYGFENFEWREIDTAKTIRSLQAKERKYISKYRMLYPSLVLNEKCGGGGTLVLALKNRIARKKSKNKVATL